MDMEEKRPILHIVVVGFHHKKGCQVEFSFPPLVFGSEGKNECPSGWKYLPTLALPDGSHNFAEDTVFFNLPSLYDPTESIYGVSCYRQIPVEKLKIRTADVTRSTVQKSVCVLALLPLYGYIEVKLSLIADAFFDQGDFSCTEILSNAYHQLNACLIDDPSPMRHVQVGLPLRDIILKWRHKTLLLFKLFLLQRRIVCFTSPVRSMCALLLGISDLHPKLLEKGFQEVACVRTSRPLSPMPDFSASPSLTKKPSAGQKDVEDKGDEPHEDEKGAKEKEVDEESDMVRVSHDNLSQIEKGSDVRELVRANSNGMDVGRRTDKNSLPRDASVDTLASTLFPLTSINPDSWHAPLPIFSSGHLCLPYLSLPYMDLLSDPSVLSYVIGTSNILFHQKKNLADIQIDVEGGTIETNDQELRRQLVLTTEDLRFIDYVIRHVQNPKEDAEGSEMWIREQFQGYMLALLKTSCVQDNSKDCEHFNGHFMTAWKKSQCFQDWYDSRPDDSFFDTVPSGHPFAGTLSVADMKLKIAQTMHNSESGRKLNQAVNTTSRAVGGAFSHAKGAFSNWWSSITTNPVTPNPQQQPQSEIDSTVTSATFQQIAKINKCNDNDDSIEKPNSSETWDSNVQEAVEEDTHSRMSLIDAGGDSKGRESQEKTVVGGDKIPIVQDDSSLTIKKKDEGIIEIGKEAETLDSNRKTGEIYTV